LRVKKEGERIPSTGISELPEVSNFTVDIHSIQVQRGSDFHPQSK
jgi:hypothetical protein